MPWLKSLKLIGRVALLVASVGAGATDLPGAATWEASRTAAMTAADQPYRNEQYGFVVPRLAAARAYRDKAPNPDHGVVLVLGEQRAITVSAEYDAADLGTSAAYLDQLLQSEGGSAGGSRARIRSAGRPAVEVTIRHADTVKRLVAVRRGAGGGINYALTLQTTSAAEAGDIKIFRSVVTGLKFVPLPH